MKRREVLVSILCLCMGIISSYLAYEMGLGDLKRPGAGFFPIVIGGLLVFFSLLYMFDQSSKKIRGESTSLSWPSRQSLKLVSIVLLILIAYTFSLNYLGFVLGSFCLVLFLIRAVGTKGWLYAVIASLFIVVPLAIVFWLFKVELPKGVIGF
jgi:hypothetical protein